MDEGLSFKCVIQFYDWMYRHHELLPRQPLFKDIFGRELSLDIVKEHVEICRRYGMKPIGYGAMWGEKDFVAEHPDWVAAPAASRVATACSMSMRST